MASRIDAESAMYIAGNVLIAEITKMLRANTASVVVHGSDVLEEQAKTRGFEDLTEQDKDEIATWIDLATLKLEVVYE